MYKYILYIVSLFVLISCSGEQKPQIPINKVPKENIKEELLQMNVVLAQNENKEILAYIKKNKLDVEKSPLAFWYKIEEKGNGKPIKKGTKVRISFNLSLLDGSVCYTPKNKGIKKMTIGKADIIKGLDEALVLLNEGGRAKFIIPADLAFGMVGDQDCIGSKKTVIYDILSVEIIP